MRRLLRDIAEGRALGDTTTLADPNVVNSLKEMYEAQESSRLQLRVPSTTGVAGTRYRLDAPGMLLCHSLATTSPGRDLEGNSGSRDPRSEQPQQDAEADGEQRLDRQLAVEDGRKP